MAFSEQDYQFMERALMLAARGAGNVSPNPLVGCVLVKDNKIIGEGLHKLYGGPHAEVNAINDASEKSEGATAYVTLEPCAHYGKTPPCADLLIEKGIARVVICNLDPFTEVNGKGIEKLKQAGIEVEIGLLAKKGEWLNRRFFTAISKNRPYVILKWAQSADGFIGRQSGPVKISNSLSHQMAHKWRSEEDAILIGAGTAKTDNPELTTRNWEGKNPIRVILAGHKGLDHELKIFNNQAQTLVFENLSVREVLYELKQKRIHSVLVEGGRKVLISFLEAGLWDEARVFVSETMLEYGIPAPAMQVPYCQPTQLNTDILFTWLNPFR